MATDVYRCCGAARSRAGSGSGLSATSDSHSDRLFRGRRRGHRAADRSRAPQREVGSAVPRGESPRCVGIYTVGGLLPHIKSGRLRALAVGGARRNPALPEVPTFGELMPGMVSATWFAMLAPPKTPDGIVAKLNAAIVEALRQPEVQKRLAELHANIIGNSPSEAAAFIRDEKRRWGEVIRAANIKPD